MKGELLVQVAQINPKANSFELENLCDRQKEVISLEGHLN